MEPTQNNNNPPVFEPNQTPAPPMQRASQAVNLASPPQSQANTPVKKPAPTTPVAQKSYSKILGFIFIALGLLVAGVIVLTTWKWK